VFPVISEHSSTVISLAASATPMDGGVNRIALLILIHLPLAHDRFDVKFTIWAHPISNR
jgi:hypothetical protein